MKLERIKRRSGGTLVLEITPLIDILITQVNHKVKN